MGTIEKRAKEYAKKYGPAHEIMPPCKSIQSRILLPEPLQNEMNFYTGATQRRGCRKRTSKCLSWCTRTGTLTT